ncbi:MAG TPA: lipocalin family protein [Casimicrobiaceae bacterium]|jgi:apolipoprotein D and lipocalin family protein|nr:lipocalin family protein [Casimicrobiaceae bacterium]
MAASLQTGKTLAASRWSIGLAFVALACAAPATALTPVADFDLNRYYGNWYEIASIPGFLQSRCARDTQSEYTAADNGAIAARARCLRSDGSIEASEARQRPLDPALPSVLKVTTVHFLGIWWYPFGRESIVIALDPEYRWLVAGHPSLRFGRILAREPALSAEALRTITAALTKEGFDACIFVFTPQTGGRTRSTRLCDDVR